MVSLLGTVRAGWALSLTPDSPCGRLCLHLSPLQLKQNHWCNLILGLLTSAARVKYVLWQDRDLIQPQGRDMGSGTLLLPFIIYDVRPRFAT